eukprot:296770-Chlamydomonas_euryale.AAC.2
MGVKVGTAPYIAKTITGAGAAAHCRLGHRLRPHSLGQRLAMTQAETPKCGAQASHDTGWALGA